MFVPSWYKTVDFYEVGISRTMSTVKYKQTLKRNRNSRVLCSCCKAMVVLHDFSRHLSISHNEHLPVNYKCCWCLRFTWSGKITDRVNDHRLHCLLQCMEEKHHWDVEMALSRAHPTIHHSYVTPPPLPPTPNVVVNTNTNSSRRRRNHHRKFYMDDTNILTNIPLPQITSMRYNSIVTDNWIRRPKYQLNLPEQSSLYCNISSMNLPSWFTNRDGVDPAHYIDFDNGFPMDVEQCGFDPMWQRFYIYKRNLSWFHISIKFSVWTDFMHFCAVNESKIVFLPYSCLCNGGQEHHRHLICVVLACNAKSLIYRPSFARTRCVLIPEKNPLHLLSTISSISSSDTSAHYHIFQPVIPYVQLFGMLYMSNGIEQYIESTYKNAYPYDCKSLGRFKQLNWSVEMRDIFPEKALIFPLPRNMHFVPYYDGANSILYVGEGNRFSVKRNDDLLAMNDFDWNTYQIAHGNCFLTNMGITRFVLGPKVQKILHVVAETMLDKDKTIERLKKKIKRLKREKTS